MSVYLYNVWFVVLEKVKITKRYSMIFCNRLSNGWRYHFGLLLFTSSNGWGSGAAKLAAFFSKKPRLSSPGAGTPDVWNEMWPKTMKHGYKCNRQVSLDFWTWKTRWWITMNYMWTCGTSGWGASHIADHIAKSCLDRQMWTVDPSRTSERFGEIATSQPFGLATLFFQGRNYTSSLPACIQCHTVNGL